MISGEHFLLIEDDMRYCPQLGPIMYEQATGRVSDADAEEDDGDDDDDNDDGSSNAG